MFTKQHYRAITEIIASERQFASAADGHCTACLCRIDAIARRNADYFEQDNPRFDRQKFLKACGIRP